MNMDFHLEGGFAALTGDQAGERLEWSGLRARFAAAYAARTALACVVQLEFPIDGGSFDRGSARALALYGMGQGGGLGGVNRTALAKCNSGCDNDEAVVSEDVAGDRGQ